MELVALDSFSEDREEQAVAYARRAVDDAAAVAYIGDFHSSQVLETAPILGEAGLLQVAPVATFADLHGPTLVRLMPHDGVGARRSPTGSSMSAREELLIVHDHDLDYGVAVGAMCDPAARARGLVVRTRPIWDYDEPWEDDGRVEVEADVSAIERIRGRPRRRALRATAIAVATFSGRRPCRFRAP